MSDKLTELNTKKVLTTEEEIAVLQEALAAMTRIRAITQQAVERNAQREQDANK